MKIKILAVFGLLVWCANGAVAATICGSTRTEAGVLYDVFTENGSPSGLRGNYNCKSELGGMYDWEYQNHHVCVRYNGVDDTHNDYDGPVLLNCTVSHYLANPDEFCADGSVPCFMMQKCAPNTVGCENCEYHSNQSCDWCKPDAQWVPFVGCMPCSIGSRALPGDSTLVGHRSEICGFCDGGYYWNEDWCDVCPPMPGTDFVVPKKVRPPITTCCTKDGGKFYDDTGSYIGGECCYAE